MADVRSLFPFPLLFTFLFPCCRVALLAFFFLCASFPFNKSIKQVFVWVPFLMLFEYMLGTDLRIYDACKISFTSLSLSLLPFSILYSLPLTFFLFLSWRLLLSPFGLSAKQRERKQEKVIKILRERSSVVQPLSPPPPLPLLQPLERKCFLPGCLFGSV